MAVRDGCRQIESPFHVATSPFGGKFALMCSIAATDAAVEIQRYCQLLAKMAGNFQRLIETALSITIGMQRYRNDACRRLAGGCDMFCQQAGQQASVFVVAVEFKLGNQMAHCMVVTKRGVGFVEVGWAFQAASAELGYGVGRVEVFAAAITAVVVVLKVVKTIGTNVEVAKASAATEDAARR